MSRKVEMAFKSHGMMIPLDNLLPLRTLTRSARHSEKYKCIAASLREVGLIEPLIVYPQKGQKRRYLLLDGHIRVEIMKSQGPTEAFCLVATEDEAYTYNHKVNQVTAIQEHFMIMKAIDNGVSEQRIAATLNVDVGAIRRKMSLLDGICPEAVTLLKDKRVAATTLREVKRVVPMRQIEMAELMAASNNYSSSYAKSLYIATSDEHRLETEKPADEYGISPEDRAKMQREMQDLKRHFKLIEETHGDNVLRLVLATGYLRSLLNNARVVRYLSQHWQDILAEFQKVIEAPEIDAAVPAEKQ